MQFGNVCTQILYNILINLFVFNNNCQMCNSYYSTETDTNFPEFISHRKLIHLELFKITMILVKTYTEFGFTNLILILAILQKRTHIFLSGFPPEMNTP